MASKKPKYELTKLSRLQVRMPGKTELESRLVVLIKDGDPIEIKRGEGTLSGTFCVVEGKLCVRNLDNTDRWVYTTIAASDKVFLKTIK